MLAGDECLDDEDPVGLEPSGDLSEESLLVSLGNEIEDRVVGDEHRVERFVGEVVDHVADDRPNTPVAVPFGELGQHRLAAVDAGDGQPGGCHRHGEAPRADAEFQYSSAGVGEFDHPIDGRCHIGDVGVPLVVHVRESVAV